MYENIIFFFLILNHIQHKNLILFIFELDNGKQSTQFELPSLDHV